MPKNEIAFIHSYNTESKKVELFRKFNAGEMRILIGSTFKLGIGANVQCKLKAIHHLDVPWRPADMVQREGRIIRRGNENDSVLIYRYITQGSFDAYSWQVLETKQKFISQFLSGSTYQRSISDLENNVLTYAQVKAMALDEPLMKQLAEKENEAKELRIFIAREADENAALQNELKTASAAISDKTYKANTAAYHTYIIEKTPDETLTKEARIVGEALTPAVIFKQEPLTVNLSILKFIFTLPDEQNQSKPYGILSRDGNSYTIELGGSPAGNARRIIGALKKMPQIAEKYKEDLQKTKDRVKQIEELLSASSSYRAKLLQTEKEIEELKSQIFKE